MKTADQVSAAKLRGGFYTPDDLVDLCLVRIDEMVGPGAFDVLEPSVGDGAFLRGLARSSLRDRVKRVQGIEVTDIEAEKSRRAIRSTGFEGGVERASAVEWAAESEATFDVAVGNPPFLRYQFIRQDDRRAIAALGERLGLTFAGVGNLWIPVLLGALSRLRPGGAFSFVVPSECFTGISSSLVRSWLTQHCDEVRFDLFPPGSFPNVLQEVFVLSGRVAPRRSDTANVRVVEQLPDGSLVDRSHRADDAGPWTKYLLAPEQVAALAAACADDGVTHLGEVVAFEVSIVTGANGFFTVSDEELTQHDLTAWGRPLLPRIRYAPGLRYTEHDHRNTSRAGVPAWILDFSAERASPLDSSQAAAYIRGGESDGLNERYKCRIREPWFRVPGFRSGELLLSKRSHHYPRVVMNDADVFTTDTIYRGRMLQSDLSACSVAANFHNSLTLLTAELEGRSFGGGVLELVPSETARLAAFTHEASADVLGQLDTVARAGDPIALVRASDESLIARGAMQREVLHELAAAREALAARRFARARQSVTPAAENMPRLFELSTRRAETG